MSPTGVPRPKSGRKTVPLNQAGPTNARRAGLWRMTMYVCGITRRKQLRKVNYFTARTT